jgi:hypothetical protein
MFSHPQFTVVHALNWATIDRLTALKNPYFISRGRSKNYSLRRETHTNPATGKLEQAMCMRLYATDILQYFHDGTIVVVCWDSMLTRSCLWDLGRIRVGSQTFRDATGAEWPTPAELHIGADGVLLNTIQVTHVSRKLKPDRQPRAVLRNELRLQSASESQIKKALNAEVFYDTTCTYTKHEGIRVR